MDYSFYLLRIGTLSESLIDRLIEYSKSSVSDPRSKSYFGKVNTGFDSHSIPSSFEDANQAVKEAVLQASLFDTAQYTSCEMNLLEAGSEIKEHTDQSSATSTTSINEFFGPLVHQWHTVHIPLTGEGAYYFRRSGRENSMQLSMERGGLYLFNNAVMHRVLNVGRDQRRNFILHFHDPEWKSKQEIYRRFSIRGMF